MSILCGCHFTHPTFFRFGIQIDILGRDVDVLDLVLQRGARVAGRNINGFDLLRLRRLPRQCMLAATTADDQYFHGCDL